MPEQLYFIAVLPHEGLSEKVKQLKLELKHRFNAKHALKSPAHITLQMPFRFLHENESQIIERLNTFAAQRKPFHLTLNGFGCFQPRVIYINIENPEPICDLHAALQPFLKKGLGLDENQTGKRFNPHMTIATRDLKEKMFYTAWDEFKERNFKADFEVSSLFLLKHNGKFWDIYREFIFDGRFAP